MGDNHEEESSGITSSDIETIISDQIHSIFISREAADGISDSLITVQEHKKLVTLLHDETNGKIFEKIENKTVLTATSTSIHERKEHSGEPPLDTLGVQVNLLNTVEVQVEPLDTSGGELVEDSDVNNGQEVLDDEPKSIIVSLLKQLRLNADLHRVTLPTFILEPRSLLERITDFMSFPQLILHSPFYEDPLERFKAVLRYFLSAWHIRPKGVKKPYNPVLGEFFRCQWHVPRPSAEFMEEVANKMAPDSCLFGHPHSDSDLTCRQHLATEILLKDQEFRSSAHGLERDLVANFGCPYCRVSGQSSSYYVAEQVSHHPPVSAYFYTNPSHHLVIQGNFRPGSKFLGNSAVSFMRGATQIHFTNRPGEVYSLTNPNYYIRGKILVLNIFSI